MRKLYLLALYALKIDPERLIIIKDDDGRVSWQVDDGVDQMISIDSPVMLWAQAVVADSEDEARQVGLESILKECPLEDGWINHHASVNTASKESLTKALEFLSEAAGGEDEEWPEPIV